ncbi:MAG: hypothetical protein GC182_13340 [Rhodopseudomonas sp.]|nr:hypothetical protein [Rhodopseudomonas sp.]
MTIAIILSVLAGTAVGFRFKIFMIVPIILAGAVLAVAISLSHGASFWSIATDIVLNAFGVQIGYLCGSFALAMKEAPLPVPSAAAESYQPQNGVPVQVSDRR